MQNFRSDEAILIEQTLTYYPYIAQNEKVVDETGTARFSITGRGDWRIYRVVDGRKIYIMTIKATNSFDGAQNYNWVVTAEASGSASVLITKKSR
ncbi:MAG: hypothetical protein HYW88_01890 [Candidatus Sungbacteria bacterium]|nr:hypothetical protein [Candidatus Sungbacteria bacterium]